MRPVRDGIAWGAPCVEIRRSLRCACESPPQQCPRPVNVVTGLSLVCVIPGAVRRMESVGGKRSPGTFYKRGKVFVLSHTGFTLKKTTFFFFFRYDQYNLPPYRNNATVCDFFYALYCHILYSLNNNHLFFYR